MGTRSNIPLENSFRFAGPDASGAYSAAFYAFNTAVTLHAYPPAAQGLRGEGIVRDALEAVRDLCRAFERAFSRTLPHSDIARINDAEGNEVEISPQTYDLLLASKRYCAESEGVFDITMGAVVRLWNFHEGIIPNRASLDAALGHVDWRMLELRESESRNRFFARLSDSQAAIDVGGIAKGYIADLLGDFLRERGMPSFLINLGGNVLVGDAKPDGMPWIVGLQDPGTTRERAERENATGIIGAVPLTNASAVTSGVYERRFIRDGKAYHHILDTRTGMPVETDIAGATVVARRSIDAEGYSTTLLALGSARVPEFVRSHPAIMAVYLVDAEGRISVEANL